MHPEEHAVNVYIKTALKHDVEKIVNKYLKSRQRWLMIGGVLIFIFYIGLTIQITLTLNIIKNDSIVTNNIKRELAFKTDSLETIRIQESRTQIEYARKTDSLKRVKLFEINDNYRKSILEWKNRKQK